MVVPEEIYPTTRPQVPSEKSLLELLREMPMGDTWDDAEMWTIYKYVKGAKSLRLPDSFKTILPVNAS